MAGSILLTPGAAVMPDGSASNAAPALQRVKSSASAPTPYSLQLAFDSATKEQACWGPIRMPADFASFPTGAAKVQYKTTATTGGVAWEVRVAAVTDGDATDLGAKAFAAANVGTATVPGTAGHLDEVAITLTNNDSVAAGDWVVFYLCRDPAHASDTAAADAALQSLTITYTPA